MKRALPWALVLWMGAYLNLVPLLYYQVKAYVEEIFAPWPSLLWLILYPMVSVLVFCWLLWALSRGPAAGPPVLAASVLSFAWAVYHFCAVFYPPLRIPVLIVAYIDIPHASAGVGFGLAFALASAAGLRRRT